MCHINKWIQHADFDSHFHRPATENKWSDKFDTARANVWKATRRTRTAENCFWPTLKLSVAVCGFVCVLWLCVTVCVVLRLYVLLLCVCCGCVCLCVCVYTCACVVAVYECECFYCLCSCCVFLLSYWQSLNECYFIFILLICFHAHINQCIKFTILDSHLHGLVTDFNWSDEVTLDFFFDWCDVEVLNIKFFAVFMYYFYMCSGSLNSRHRQTL